ncbi:cytochrome P450 [Myriangium duriaei CBS 260.36]|uniref:Cytochrome P450 n=1 Tax=Myriangium duriaei CBS 260.36 TaxID=1168546 RepID=A0A9P4MD97_9PEZI|nr:cytochrome P450 [Myriangium duriaei CBS 260.36]
MVLGLGQVLLALSDEERRIQKFGGHAPKMRRAWTSLGLGLDVFWSSVQHAKQHKDLVWWSDIFSNWGMPGRPWTVEARVLGTRIIYTADQENIEAILASQFDNFRKGAAVNEGYHDFLGNSFATIDGQQWWDYRKIIRYHLTKRCVSDLEILESKVQIFLPLLATANIVDTTDLFTRLSLDSFTASFLGHGVDTLHENDQQVSQAFREVQHVQNLIGLSGPLKMFVSTRNFHAGLKILNDFVQPIVDRAIGFKQCNQHDHQKATFLYTLSEFTSDRKAIRDQVVTLLVAGRDSTSNTLSWMFYHLGLQPGLVARLREEILETVGGQRCPTFEELKSMKLLQHTISETLRLYPSLAVNFREAARDTTLPRGGGEDGLSPIGILKGTPIAFSTLCLHRKANERPPAANFPDWSEFAPDRWTIWTPGKTAYMPFSQGRRACIGHEFAVTHIAYVTTRILQTYTSFDCRMEREPELDCTTTIRPSQNIKLSFHRS